MLLDVCKTTGVASNLGRCVQQSIVFLNSVLFICKITKYKSTKFFSILGFQPPSGYAVLSQTSEHIGTKYYYNYS